MILCSDDRPNNRAIFTLLDAGGQEGAETVTEYLSGREDLDELLMVRLAYAQLICNPNVISPIKFLQDVLSATRDARVKHWTVTYLCESLPAHPEIRNTLLPLLQDDDFRYRVAKSLNKCEE